MTLLIDVQSVRDYLVLNAVPSTSQYTDATISSNIEAAQSELEQACSRYFAPRTYTAQNPWRKTTMYAPVVSIPGFRSFTTVSWSGSILAVDANDPVNPGLWALPDALNTGVYTALQFRPYRSDYGYWWLSDPLWFDKNLDSPFYPGNYGGGVAYTSMPNDLLIVGEAGYDPDLAQGIYGSPPPAVLQAVKALASWHTMRPASVFSDVATTPQSNTLPYSSFPPEVQSFIASWTLAGPGMVSVG